MPGLARHRTPSLVLAVGLVLADSSVVTLALPDVLRGFDARVGQVAWVLIAFNLVLALAAVPAARLAGRVGATPVYAAGLALFAAASLACALAPSLGALIAARCAQGLGGAAAVCAALELLAPAAGSRARALRLWVAAGVIGTALGPAVGGLLTELISWQSIFVVQVPLALVALIARPRIDEARARAAEGPAHPPHVAANVALGLISAALTAALFLLVLLIIEGWRHTPAIAAATVSLMPVAALAAGRLGRGLATAARALAGAVLIAGGLAALGLLPGAGPGWTLAPQALIGLGLGLALSALTDAALHERTPEALHGAWTIGARHLGVVVGLLLLTPLFTADLERQQHRAQEAGVALLLDAPIAPLAKLDLAVALADRIRGAGDRIPDLGPAFDRAPGDVRREPAFHRLESGLEDQLARAGTDAFSRSFLAAALLALLALVPLALDRRRLGRA